MRKIYIYETPGSKDAGYIKIGDSTDVHKRVNTQFNTASVFDADNLEYTLLYQTEAVKADGSQFRDHDIHAILEQRGYHKRQIIRDNEVVKGKTEWFQIDVKKAIHLIEKFKEGVAPERIDIDRFQSFPMRPEQADAVERTERYFMSRSDKPVEMLWNAKMRFGKTFTAYQLARRMKLSKVLVLTYKPAVEAAWREDLETHVDFNEYVFLQRESLARIDEHLKQGRRVVAFASYQDLLGKQDEDNEIKEKHRQLFGTHWDVVIIDEFHYGAGTEKAREMIVDQQASTAREAKELKKELVAEEDEEFEEEQHSEVIVEQVEKAITSDYRLYLSGTPFKAIADSKFDRDAIFNWTYTDEQKAKEEWDINFPERINENPYRSLPQIQLFVYKVSDDLLKAGVQEGKDEFSLNYFFKAKNKKFLNEPAVRAWLDLISGVAKPKEDDYEKTQEETEYEPSQYPFDHNSKFVNELDHTLWYLNRVDSAYALRDLLKEHAIFKHYHIILAAGKEMGSGVDAVQPVKEAIDRNVKTITISVGKLTTGVSIPKWKGVLFLRDTDSPENYFQTAFRAQTPFTEPSTKKLKETCYLFDFSPNRSLRLLTAYSEKLSSDSHLTTSEARIAEFIRYLPVLKVQGNQMVTMDARDVLTFDLSGIDAKGLGARFTERKNVVVTRDTIDAINASEQSAQRCQEIFDKIKMFKKFVGASDKEMESSDVSVADLDANNKRVKKLETKDTKDEKEKKERDKELDKAEKELKSEREKVRDLLRTLLSRIPIFMYLTDATEENLEQVLIEDRNDLFRKTTGITVDDFRYLRDIGLIRVDSIDGYILKFVQLESQNYEINNELRNGIIIP